MYDVDVKNRVNFILKERGISVRQLSSMINVPQKSLNNQVSPANKAQLPLETIILIVKTLGNISADWLLLGEGDPHQTKNSGPSVSMDTMTGGQIQVGGTNNTMSAESEKKILELEAVNRHLSMLLQIREKQIEELKADKEMLHQYVTNLTKK